MNKPVPVVLVLIQRGLAKFSLFFHKINRCYNFLVSTIPLFPNRAFCTSVLIGIIHLPNNCFFVLITKYSESTLWFTIYCLLLKHRKFEVFTVFLQRVSKLLLIIPGLCIDLILLVWINYPNFLWLITLFTNILTLHWIFGNCVIIPWLIIHMTVCFDHKVDIYSKLGCICTFQN